MDANTDSADSLHAAAAEGNKLMMRILFKNCGLDILKEDENGLTPVHHAVANNHVDAAQWLAENAARRSAHYLAAYLMNRRHDKNNVMHAKEAEGMPPLQHTHATFPATLGGSVNKTAVEVEEEVWQLLVNAYAKVDAASQPALEGVCLRDGKNNPTCCLNPLRGADADNGVFTKTTSRDQAPDEHHGKKNVFKRCFFFR